jgi:16S rRNA (guanine1207-N2)-methyltransferase
MTEHYFTKHPSSRGGRMTFTVTLRGHELRLTTEAGIFSRSRVDPGTRLLIQHMEVAPTDTILDLGCGYGAVGVVAAKLAPQGRVTLVDINERAVALAAENLRLNRIDNAETIQGDGFAPVAGRRFDLIALNPPIRAGNAVVHGLIERARDHLTAGGRFYLVGRTQQGVVRLAAKTAEVFDDVHEVAKGGGYRVYLASLHSDSRKGLSCARNP